MVANRARYAIMKNRNRTSAEILFTFRLPLRGALLAVKPLRDGSLAALIADPMTLHVINREMDGAMTLDLYEQFPLKGSRLKVAPRHDPIVTPQLSVLQCTKYGEAIFVLNPHDGAAVVLELSRNVLSSFSVRSYLLVLI